MNMKDYLKSIETEKTVCRRASKEHLEYSKKVEHYTKLRETEKDIKIDTKQVAIKKAIVKSNVKRLIKTK